MSFEVLLEKNNVLPINLSSLLNCLRIEMNGVIPAPPAIKYPGPLYSIAPHTSRIMSSSLFLVDATNQLPHDGRCSA